MNGNTPKNGGFKLSGNIITKLLLSVMLLTLAFICTACNPASNENNADASTAASDTTASEEAPDSSVTEAESNTAAETEVETEVGYIDLSGEFSPVIEENKNRSAKATAIGEALSSNDIVLRFDGNEENYSIEPYGIIGNYHDSHSCPNCKYESKNGDMTFHICNNPSSHSGLTLILDTPINAYMVSGIQMTFMTSNEIKNSSQLRIQKITSTSANSDGIVNFNGCPDISGATQNWKTIDFGMSFEDIMSMADDDGYLRGFKICLRDKDNADIYIKSFTITTSIDSIKSICKVNALHGNYYGQGDAAEAVAQEIAARLTEFNIGAEVEVKALSRKYVQNTTVQNGSFPYTATLTLADGETLSCDNTADIRKIEGIWLPLGQKTYGAERDAKEQWKSGFDKSGIICLEDNLLKAPEKLVGVEYAVIGKNDDLTDTNTVWFVPHLLEIGDEGIKKLYANAYLDYGNSLIEGNEYRFLVRGVTENENYILHLDIPFIYTPISADAQDKLNNAMTKTEGAEFSCAYDVTDKEAHIKNAAEALLNDDGITVFAETVNAGVSEGVYKLYFTYNQNVTSQSFPSYSLDGIQRSDFFAYKGTLFTKTFKISYGTNSSYDIILAAPFDGQENVRIASEEIVNFWDTDADKLITYLHDYKYGELCDPVPVKLTWSDKESNATAYTISISESMDFANPLVYETSETNLDVYNLKAGQRYYWKVERDGAVSAIFTFVTEAGYPRYILTDTVSNFRDIGGHITTDGKTVKQGLAYRFSNVDSVNAADIKTIVGYLGVKTELDLRGQNSTSRLGSTVTAIPVGISSYSLIFNSGESEPIRKAISVFANADNYPIGYHCAIGRDRTGTVSALLLGLLGVDEDTILKEYMLSKKSMSGNGTESAAYLYEHYSIFIDCLDKFGDENDTFQNKVEAYLLSIGVTEAEIASIRNIFLED